MLCRSAVVTFAISVLLAPISIGQSRKQSVEKAGAPVVKLDSGLVMGMPLRANSNEVIFKGIPYAAPPVGDLRWRPPQPVKPWQGVRPATESCSTCPQPDLVSTFNKSYINTVGGDVSTVPLLGKTDEDCLFLNVATGNLGGKARQPVMVWIHGGAGFVGRGSEWSGEGAYLVHKGVVVVTINYRLGVLGFLAHPALSKESPRGVSGNYGLLDMIEALKWVRRNIEVFGGDPHRVTIFGESAGSEFITCLLASPLARGFFHRAIAQSGIVTFLQWISDIESSERMGEQFATKLGITDTIDVLSALRNKSAEELVTIATPTNNPYRPVIDGWVLPESPDLANAKRRNNVPLIVGSTADEGTAFIFSALGLSLLRMPREFACTCKKNSANLRIN